jgi:two-component system, chemotaxis family, chemotaxis protein CheY
MQKTAVKTLMRDLNVLIVDSNSYMRQLSRTMLMSFGATAVSETCDGLAALDAIRAYNPDVVLLEWDLPVLGGIELVRIVRSPGVFPRPDVPIIMLTHRGQRSCVREARRAGVHEFLVKPTSPNALRDHLVSVALKPRPMIQLGDYYVPKPRELKNDPIQQIAGICS